MTRRHLLIFTLPWLSLLIVNCSGKPEEFAPPSEGALAVVYTPTEFAVIEDSGRILAYQDVKFRLEIPGAGAGVTYVLENAPSWASLDSVAGEVTGLPLTASVTNDFKILVTDGGVTTTLGPYALTVIGDPLKAQQWHLSNTGQKTFSGESGIANQDLRLGTTISEGILGAGIRIAISDTGIQESHPNLSPSLIPGASRNYSQNYSATKTWIGNSTPSTSTPVNAHGTAVAGIAAERGWMGTGARGVAPLAQIAGFLFIQAQSVLAQRGLIYSALYDQFAGNFDIFNYSWGDPQCMLLEYSNTVLSAKMKQGVTGLRGGKGAIYVKASGNDYRASLSDCTSQAGSMDEVFGNANFSEDATTPYTILVGALSAKGISSSYSSPGSNVWIAAPGGEFGLASHAISIYQQPAILTTDFMGCSYGIKIQNHTRNSFEGGASGNETCRHTSTMNGTSSASPTVTGATALLLSANPNLTWRDVKHIFASTATQVDPAIGDTTHPDGLSLAGHVYEQGWITNQAGYKFHNWYGFGRINVDAAVAMAKSYVSTFGPLVETNANWSTGSGLGSGVLNQTVSGGSSTGFTHTLTVASALTAVEAVQIRVSAQNCIGTLGLELTSPQNTKSILMNINSQLVDDEITSHIFLSNAFYGEAANGNWTLKAIGGKSGCNPILKSWQINVIGH